MGILISQFRALCLCLCLVSSMARSQSFGRIYPGFEGSPMNWLDHNGLFLLSNNSMFSLGFYNALEVSAYALVLQHVNSSVAIWTGNRGMMVNLSDRFVFDKNGNVYLEGAEGPNGVVWSTGTAGRQVSYMELKDSGNLVLVDESVGVVWESFGHPSDTLVPGQEFVGGMRLKSFPLHETLFHYLEILSGDLVLYVEYRTKQVYWSVSSESRKSGNVSGGKVHSASLVSNSWNFYDETRVLVWKFVFDASYDASAFWVAVLGTDGMVSFKNLNKPKSGMAAMSKIPGDICSVPEHCGNQYEVCSFGERCQCPDSLKPIGCKPQAASPCNDTNISSGLLYVGEKLDYFALGFVQPELSKSDLSSCREACLRNCSCLVLFFNSSSGDCFLFDQVGNFQRAEQGSLGVVSYMKIIKNDAQERRRGGKGKQSIVSVLSIVLATIVAISGMVYIGFWYFRRKWRSPESSSEGTLEDDGFLELSGFSGLPVRYSYNDLLKVTNNFASKIGEGGFGSVYSGALQDGTLVAVKKLEGVGQGRKEFRAEVSIIGSVHHLHLVKLKGYCAEGAHRLLVYEHMGNGSLDKWIFNNDDGRFLDWSTRFKIALGTARGLAYLHEECEFKIVHCDVKPENVLLDDNFTAKVSDFGLARLMDRDDSFVHTTMRGTRGYLAPEWITSYAISEKSDVYSYGLVLQEIIAGRKSYEPGQCSERSNFPAYAFRMVEEGRAGEIVDPGLDLEENDSSSVGNAIRVALWCIQDEMRARPAMTRVVQMLEGLCDVPDPPPGEFHAGASFLKWSGGEGERSSSGFADSAGFLSGSRLSGPR